MSHPIPESNTRRSTLSYVLSLPKVDSNPGPNLTFENTMEELRYRLDEQPDASGQMSLPLSTVEQSSKVLHVNPAIPMPGMTLIRGILG